MTAGKNKLNAHSTLNTLRTATKDSIIITIAEIVVTLSYPAKIRSAILGDLREMHLINVEKFGMRFAKLIYCMEGVHAVSNLVRRSLKGYFLACEHCVVNIFKIANR